jgi:hypothetical protein
MVLHRSRSNLSARAILQYIRYTDPDADAPERRIIHRPAGTDCSAGPSAVYSKMFTHYRP